MTLMKLKNEPARLFGMNQFLNEFFEDFPQIESRKWNTPAVNIVETDQNYRIELASPGMKKEDYTIHVEDKVLTVSAQHKSEKDTNTDKFTRKEFSFDSFSRSFNLPDSIDADSIAAQYENGVMKLTLPKTEPAKPKTRSIQVG